MKYLVTIARDLSEYAEVVVRAKSASAAEAKVTTQLDGDEIDLDSLAWGAGMGDESAYVAFVDED